MSLGTNIQYLRKLNKLTQEQLAEKMNITRQTVSRWESDEVTPELSKLVYEKDGVNYMDIYVHAASVTKVDAYSTFN